MARQKSPSTATAAIPAPASKTLNATTVKTSRKSRGCVRQCTHAGDVAHHERQGDKKSEAVITQIPKIEPSMTST